MDSGEEAWLKFLKRECLVWCERILKERIRKRKVRFDLIENLAEVESRQRKVYNGCFSD